MLILPGHNIGQLINIFIIIITIEKEISYPIKKIDFRILKEKPFYPLTEEKIN